jgi:hypothetical protein
MDVKPVPFRSPLGLYEQQAQGLLAGHRAADPAAIDLFHNRHPRFLDEKFRWRRKFMPASEIRDVALSLDDARLAIARYHDWWGTSPFGRFMAVARRTRGWPSVCAPSAVLGGHEAVVRLLVERGARLNIRDAICAVG